MSAYLCSPETISALVNFAGAHSMHCNGLDVPRWAADLAFKKLMQENQRSLEYRYGKGRGRVSEWFVEPVPLFCLRKSLPPDPAQVVELVNEYDYQACEHPEYETSEVRALVMAVKTHAESHVAEMVKARAPVVPCALCGHTVSNDPEATLAHLQACEAGEADMGRDEAIKRIRAGLKARSGKTWSVAGSRGTSWGWISVSAPPKRLVDGSMTAEDEAELARLMALDHAHRISIPSGSDYYREYVARAEGREPLVYGKPYWD